MDQTIKLSMAKQHTCIGSGETQATLIMLGWITGNGDKGTCNDRMTYLWTKSTGTDMMLNRAKYFQNMGSDRKRGLCLP